MPGCRDQSRLPGGDSHCCEDPGSMIESLCPVEYDHCLEKANIVVKTEQLGGCVERECKWSRKTSLAGEVVLGRVN